MTDLRIMSPRQPDHGPCFGPVGASNVPENSPARSARRPLPHRRCPFDPHSAGDDVTVAERVAYVLGGGGLLGAHEVGMLRALGEAGIRPDLVVGTSIGAINGAFVAADPDGAAKRLADLWQGESLRMVFSETVL